MADRERFFNDGFGFFSDGFDRFDGDAGDFEFEDVGSSIEVSPSQEVSGDKRQPGRFRHRLNTP